MSRGSCVIKGDKQGLSLCIPEGVEIAQVVEELRARLSASKDFFQGASVRIQKSSQELNPEERGRLEQVVEEFGMELREDNTELTASTVEEATEPVAEGTLLVRRTVRSGQKIHYQGNIVVLGDVNPGGELVCSGDILVLGALRGVAHAGINGNSEAVVFAFRLEPTQLRIAQYISRAPDEKVPHPTGPEIAQVIDNLIQIRAYNHQF